MKILFVNTAPLITYGLGPAFKDLGNEVKYINVSFGDPLEPAIEQFNPDLVFNDGGIDIFSKLFPLLNRKGVPHVYWAIEDPTNYNLSLPYARLSSLVLTPCRESIPKYASQGIQAALMMFACNPSFHYRGKPSSGYQYDLAFVGNNYDYHPARRQGIKNIIIPALKGYHTKIFGNEWWLDTRKSFYITPRHYAGYLPNEDLPELCASTKIILGIHSVSNSETMMSMRTFEILGCGGFYLTQWTKAIEYNFKNHYHLVWSKSAVETKDLIDFYLERPDLREKIARQGQQEVYRRHTYHHRIKELIKLLNYYLERCEKS